MKRRNIILSICYIAIGGVLFVLSMTGLLGEIYTGFGAGLAVVGAIQLIRAVRMATDKDYQEKIKTEIKDERNRYIQMKAWSWTGYLMVMLSGIATVVFMILGQNLYMQIAGTIVCIIVLLYWVSFVILRRKY